MAVIIDFFDRAYHPRRRWQQGLSLRLPGVRCGIPRCGGLASKGPEIDEIPVNSTITNLNLMHYIN
jgi:hypothetical protein